jgi:hypothetical protein
LYIVESGVKTSSKQTNKNRQSTGVAT